MAKQTEDPKVNDLMTDILNDPKNQAQRRPGMLTPAEMEAREQGGQGGENSDIGVRLPDDPGDEGAGGGKQGAQGQGANDESAELTEEQKATIAQLDALQKKVDAGEELNEEEAAILVKLRTEKPQQFPEKTFNIDGTSYTYDEMVEKVREHYNVGEVSFSDKAMEKLVEDYYKSQNRTAATRAISQGQQTNAKERQRNEQEKSRLDSARAEIVANQKMFARAIDELIDDMAELQTIADDPITKEQAEEGDLDVKRRYFKKTEAIERLAKLNTRKQQLETEGEKAENLKINNEVSAFLLAQPQYQTKEPISVVIQKMKSGEIVDPQDRMKVQELRSLLEVAQKQGDSLESVYEYHKSTRKLAISPLAISTRKVPLNLPEPKNSTVAELIQRAKDRVKNSMPNSNGSGGGGTQPASTRKRLSQAIIEHDQGIMGRETDDFARELGFGPNPNRK